MQGRSFKNNEVVQQIYDETRTYKLLGSDRSVDAALLYPLMHLSLFLRVVFLESRPTEDPSLASNLYILAGHENSY